MDLNCMALITSIGAAALQHFLEAAAIALLVSVGDILEFEAIAGARDTLDSTKRLRPERVGVMNPDTGEQVILPASAVAAGMKMTVAPGGQVPCDGIVIEGHSSVDESMITGESKPSSKSPGGHVFGGSINAGRKSLLLETTVAASESFAVKCLRIAKSGRGPTEKLIDRCAMIFAAAAALAGVLMLSIPWAFGSELGRYWTSKGLITIVIACPYAIVISFPVTSMAALAAAIQRGVLVKGGQHFEGLGQVRSILFDKTGTLSRGVFELVHFIVVGQSHSRKEVLGYLALLEKQSRHPLASAIIEAAADEQIAISNLQLQNYELLLGDGITADVEGERVHVGNKKLFQRLSLYDRLPQDVKDATDEWAESGGTIGFVGIGGDGIIGAYCITDEIRDEAKDAMAALKDTNIEVVMLTGDQQESATAIGKRLGLDDNEIKSDLSPDDKVKAVADKMKENNKLCCTCRKGVMMVGDGVQDTLALSIADVSVAMGQSSSVATDAANVTLVNSNLHKLLYIVKMGRRVTQTRKQNMALGLIVKSIVTVFAITGHASLWGAVLADVGVTLAVSLNGMKLFSSPGKDTDLKDDFGSDPKERIKPHMSNMDEELQVDPGRSD